jgi:hypothetical protein
MFREFGLPVGLFCLPPRRRVSYNAFGILSCVRQVQQLGVYGGHEVNRGVVCSQREQNRQIRTRPQIAGFFRKLLR